MSKVWPVAAVPVLAQLLGVLSTMRDFERGRQVLSYMMLHANAADLL